MNNRSFGLTFALALTAGISATNFPVAAQSPLGKAMGEKWAKSCLTESAKTAYRQQLQRAPAATTIAEATAACCRREKTNDSACKNVDKDQGGRVNCQQGQETCQTIVKADPGLKADLDKATADNISTVTVNNDGKVPLKVVILDMGKYDIGRTPDYKLGDMPPITLKQKVSKYHWEVFAPGAQEPCQVGHDETRSSITVHCQPSKAEEKPATPVSLPLPVEIGKKWADKCLPNGDGGAMGTCCSRQRRAEASCTQQPVLNPAASNCDMAEKSCQAIVR
jgi:hypothetical protein